MTEHWLTPIRRQHRAERSHVSDSVVDALVERIRGGRLRQGDQISSAEIAREQGVARASVREAILRLERVGVVVAEPGRFTRVADVTADLVAWVGEAAAWDMAFAAEKGVPALRGEAVERARVLAREIGECAGWSEAVTGPALRLGQLFAHAHANALHHARIRDMAPAIEYFLGAAKTSPDISLEEISRRLVGAIAARDARSAAMAMRRLYAPVA